MRVIRRIRRAHGARYVLFRHIPYFVSKERGQLFGQLFFAVDIEIRIPEAHAGKRIHIVHQQLRVVSHHGAVVVIIRFMFVHIAGQARVENRVHALADQGLDMPVHQFGGVARRVGGDAVLTLCVQRPAGKAGKTHAETEFPEKGIPEGPQLVHAERQR